MAGGIVSKNNPKARGNKNEPHKQVGCIARYMAMGAYFTPRCQRKAGQVKPGTARSRAR